MQSPAEAVRRQRFACRVCESEGDADVFRAREMMFGSREPFDYAKCGACGCLQIVSVPGDLARHYPPDYYSMAPRDEPAKAQGLKQRLIEAYCRSVALAPASLKAAAARRLLPEPQDFARFGAYLQRSRLHSADERILDVGCGASPYVLAAFRRCGFRHVEGIDPFIAQDLEYHGVPVRKRELSAMEGRFGLVMFHHALEHMPDPMAALRKAAQLLRPGGTCLVRIPVVDTFFWRTYGLNWVELDAPRHLYLFGVKALARAAESAGFVLRDTVFDSEPWELAGSVLYQRDIPLRSSPDLNSHFSAEEREGFRRDVARLNAANDAGRACFYLERR